MKLITRLDVFIGEGLRGYGVFGTIIWKSFATILIFTGFLVILPVAAVGWCIGKVAKNKKRE